MKKLAYIIGILSIMLFFTSCFEKVDNWYSNTFSFDGRYVVGIECEEDDDYTVDIKFGYELWISNSAANIENEIIIDTHVAIVVDEYMDGDFVVYEIEDEGYPIKGKFKVSGDPSNFKGASESVNFYYENGRIASANEYYIIYNNRLYSLTAYTADELDEEASGVQLYSRITLDAGKITPLGATTFGGNKSDAVELKITTYCDYVDYIAYEIPEANWTVPGVPEYRWKIVEGSRENAEGWEEHWTLKGYRCTGYPEDIGTQPPIIEK